MSICYRTCRFCSKEVLHSEAVKITKETLAGYEKITHRQLLPSFDRPTKSCKVCTQFIRNMSNFIHANASALITNEELLTSNDEQHQLWLQQSNQDDNEEIVESEEATETKKTVENTVAEAAAVTEQAVDITDEQKAHSLEQPIAKSTRSKFKVPVVNPPKESGSKLPVRNCLSFSEQRLIKPFVCDVLSCEKSFKLMKSKRQHMTMVHKNKQNRTLTDEDNFRFTKKRKLSVGYEFLM